MNKLRLDIDGLEVQSFTPVAGKVERGTVEAHQDTYCSCAKTCGVMSRGEEGYKQVPWTWYACCV